MQPGDKVPLVHLPIATPDGEFNAAYSAKGLAQLHFPTARRHHSRPVASRSSPTVRSWHRVTKAALKATLTGRSPRTLPPLDLSAGTKFQQSVWRAMRKIPPGETRSYGEIAKTIGKPKAMRAVGGACGANPIPVLIPCHRVLAAHQKIGGFGGGLEWKRTLLTREGVTV